MSELKSIYSKLGKVMSQVSRVPKNGYNSFHKYNYATESDLTESIRPILLEAGLAFFSNVLDQERDGEFTKVKMEFTLADIETGEILKSVYWGEGQDKGDKGLYKAYTGATKYFLMKTFLIPTGDDPEADHSIDERNASKSSAPKQPQRSAAPMDEKTAAQMVVSFGKNKGKTLKEIYLSDKSYLDWMLNSDKTNETFKQAIRIMFDAVAKKQGTQPEPPPMDYSDIHIDESDLPFPMTNGAY